MLTIKNHQFTPAKVYANVPMGGQLRSPKFLVIHITAGRTAESSIGGWVRDRQASAHTIVDRDASLHQCVPLDRVAFHAGRSAWRGHTDLNDESIGLEIANWGDLKQRADGAYVSWANAVVPANQVVMARHKFGGPVLPWEIIPEAVIEIVCQQIALIGAAYPSIVEVVEHCDIAPARRRDPGPAAPMDRFKAALSGRGSNTAPDVWAVQSASGLNVRSGPSAQGIKIAELHDGEKVLIEARSEKWRRIRSQARPTIGGWVHEAYLIDVL